MALTVTSDLTDIALAEASTTTWGFFGSGANSSAIEPDFFAQGSNCYSVNSSGAGTVEGLVYDNGAGIDFTSSTHAGKLVYIWVRAAAFSLIDTRANGGIRIIIGSGTTRPQAAAGAWSAWYVDGSDTFAGTDGFKCYVIDPRKPPSTSFGTLDLTGLRWFGAAEANTGTLKGQNFGVDAIRYGFGELRARGENTTAGAGFKEMADADFGTLANRYGIMVEKEGVFFVTGRLVLGDAVSTNSTTFTSQNETLAWTYPVYWDGTRESPCIAEQRNDGTPYFGITCVGNGTGNTSITFGAKVGTGDTASGRNGPVLIGSRQKTSFDGDDSSVEVLNIYGSTFNRFRGGIDLTTSTSGFEFIGNSVIASGSTIATGSAAVKLRGNTFVDNLGAAYRGFEDFINARASGAEALTTADPKYNWLAVLNGSNLSVPSATAGYVELLDPGASDRREVVQVTGVDSGAAVTITVSTTGTGTFTRSAGSYLTDGFLPGMFITTRGFSNAGNNTDKVIANVTATVITVTSNSGLVNETGDGNEQVVAELVNSDNHYVEAIVRWPSAGANQGALGVTMRGATGTTENYWYLKADIVASLLSLIRCDTGTDTTVTSTAVTFAENTDYLLHLYGSGTTIEGFCSGNGATYKLSTTSSTYQTNRRVGIRADAEADQTSDAPRLSRFGAGPITDSKGAIVLASASDDASYSKYINNARAYDLTTTGTYGFSNDTLSGNMVETRNDTGGTATLNITNGSSPVAIENVGAATTSVVVTVSITITVVDESNDPIQNAQIYIQKSATGKQWNYTSDTGNNAGDADFVVNETVDTDLPQSGWLHVWDESTNTKQNYRYSSWSSKTFTFPSEVTGTATSAGTSTTLNSTGIGSLNIQEGDAIRNTTDGSWAVVDELSTNSATTTALTGGSDNTWDNSDSFSVHRLAINYTDNDDLVDIPIFNGQTDTNGQISTTYAGTSLAVLIRIRSNQGSPKYIPFQTNQSITTDGLTMTAVLTTDTVAT